MNRFAIFSMDGLCLSILNGYFDSENSDKVVTRGKVYEEYDDCVRIAKMQNTGKIVINLSSDDLKKEYDRICALGIGSSITEIRYINARNPYYYFSMKDPDDNTIEITGSYVETGGEWE
ncbi:MAG: glyoxalase/bleomycin resistance/dioxygenase family protein [Oscillospiraceae bacterium]|nr:glyoxalase/bleomycin resistance/dioxygenase family protein [Oscillospiraceae bacterium]